VDAKADTAVKGSAASSTLGLGLLEVDVDSTSTFRTKKMIDSDRGPCGLIVRWTRCISVILPQYEEALLYLLKIVATFWCTYRVALRTGYSVIIYSVGMFDSWCDTDSGPAHSADCSESPEPRISQQLTAACRYPPNDSEWLG